MISAKDPEFTHPFQLCFLRWFCAILLSVIVIPPFIYIGNSPPSCSIQYLYVPALNKLINSSTTGTSLVFFDLELENLSTLKGVRYNTINITFSYRTNTTTAAGTYTVPGFYQGIGKAAWRRGVALVTAASQLQPYWEEAARSAISNGSTAGFRVDLATRVKLKYFFFYSPVKRVAVGGRVQVDGSGGNVGDKAIKLSKSGASIASASRWGMICFVVATLLFLG